jgi:hypothetical protein
MRVHLMVNVLELLLFYAVGLQIERLYHGHASFFHLYHFVTSLCLVTLLPTAGVWWMERSLKTEYDDLAGRTRGSRLARAATSRTSAVRGSALMPFATTVPRTAAKTKAAAGQVAAAANGGEHTASSDQHQGINNSSRSSSLQDLFLNADRINPSATSSTSTAILPAALNVAAPAAAHHREMERTSRQVLLDSIASSFELLQLSPGGRASDVRADPPGAPTADVAARRAKSGLAQVAPALTSLLRAEEAAEVFTAAAAGSAVMGGGQSMYHYTSMAQCVPASIKVRLAWCLCNLCVLQW